MDPRLNWAKFKDSKLETAAFESGGDSAGVASANAPDGPPAVNQSLAAAPFASPRATQKKPQSLPACEKIAKEARKEQCSQAAFQTMGGAAEKGPQNSPRSQKMARAKRWMKGPCTCGGCSAESIEGVPTCVECGEPASCTRSHKMCAPPASLASRLTIALKMLEMASERAQAVSEEFERETLIELGLDHND